MAKRKVRVIRTWETEVDAEYGDYDEDLLSKVTEQYLDEASPSAETRVLIPDDRYQPHPRPQSSPADTVVAQSPPALIEGPL